MAEGHSPCSESSSSKFCCPFGYTCFSNHICIATDPGTGAPFQNAVRGSCTDDTWDTGACGDFCLGRMRPGRGGTRKLTAMWQTIRTTITRARYRLVAMTNGAARLMLRMGGVTVTKESACSRWRQAKHGPSSASRVSSSLRPISFHPHLLHHSHPRPTEHPAGRATVNW